MTTKVQKMGNSLGIHIPKKLAEELSLTKGSLVSIDKKSGSLIIKPQKNKKTLKELCDQITPENQHEEIDWGAPFGKEVW
jgi:antitoxin MazE